MEECNGTNLKPILPMFFNKRMKIWMVLVLSRDSWLKRQHGSSTNVGLKVLIIPLGTKGFLKIAVANMWESSYALV
jgi:hypothetical protein